MKTTIETTVQHTAGPWHIGMKPGPMVYGPNGEQTADLRCGAMLPSDEAKANLRLICAAPDLLGALQALTDILPGLIRQLPYGVPMSVSVIHDAAKAAIAKATE